MRPAIELEKMVRDNRRRLPMYDRLGRYVEPKESPLPMVLGVVLVCGWCLLARLAL